LILRREPMKIKELIKKLKNYDENLECLFMLVEDDHDSNKDILIKWIGEIDTSMIDSEDPRIEFGFERRK
jgi:hypothetical protein